MLFSTNSYDYQGTFILSESRDQEVTAADRFPHTVTFCSPLRTFRRHETRRNDRGSRSKYLPYVGTARRNEKIVRPT